jgi:hypothetical protein
MRVLALLPLLALAACGSGPAPVRAPGAPRAVAAPDPLAPPWRVPRDGRLRTQQLVLSARLTSVTDSVIREDSLGSALTAQWSAGEAAPVRWVGMVTAFEVRSGIAGPPRVPEGVVLPISFVAQESTSGTQPEFVIPSSDDCGSLAAAVVQGWRELWVTLPQELRPGDRWQDSSAYIVCRDGIPLRVTAVREFEAEGAELRDGVARVVVSRRSRLSFAGEGVQFGDSVAVTGSAAGTARLSFPLAGGAFTGDGESVLRLELRGRRRQQHLTQESRLEIRAP